MATEDEMVGWYLRLSGHEFKQTEGDGEGQESLACCSLWGCKESDMTERLNGHVNNGLLLNHKKEQNSSICIGVDRPRGYHTE